MTGVVLGFMQIVLAASAQDRVNLTGRFITCTAATGSFDISINGGGFFPFQKGLQVESPEMVRFIELRDTSLGTNTIDVYVTEGRINDARNVTIGGGGSSSVDDGGVVTPLGASVYEKSTAGSATIVSSAANVSGVNVRFVMAAPTGGGLPANTYVRADPGAGVSPFLVWIVNQDGASAAVARDIFVPAGWEIECSVGGSALVQMNYDIL